MFNSEDHGFCQPLAKKKIQSAMIKRGFQYDHHNNLKLLTGFKPRFQYRSKTEHKLASLHEAKPL